MFLVFIMLNGGTLSYMIYYALTNSESMSNSVITLALVVGAFVFLGLTLMLTLFYFITDYFIDKIWRLNSFASKKSPAVVKSISRYQVAPLSIEELN